MAIDSEFDEKILLNSNIIFLRIERIFSSLLYIKVWAIPLFPIQNKSKISEFMAQNMEWDLLTQND